MGYRVLISAPYMIAVVDRFRPVLEDRGIELVVAEVCERLVEGELTPLVGDVDGVICGDDAFTEQVLACAPRLRVVVKWGTGIDSIDLEACRRRGIVVRNTPGAFSDPVADSVLGYVLCFARGLVEMDRGVRRGTWRKRNARALNELALGVIGVGNVGKAVVRRARAFGMQVLGNDPVAMPSEFLDATRISMVPQEQLLREADFVSLNCDLNPTSFHLLDSAALALMKGTGVVINTARGAVVDEGALVHALRSRRIAGAALDVFEAEPLPADSSLREFENVLLAPHNANASPSAWERVHQNSIRCLLEELGRSRS